MQECGCGLSAQTDELTREAIRLKTKNKTHRGAKKRIKVTATGKLMRRRAMSSHLLTKKSSKRKRKFRKDNVLNATDRARVRDLIGA